MPVQTITRLSGLTVQPNSFAADQGGFEELENALISQDNMVSKRRGSRLHARLPYPARHLFHAFQTRYAVSTEALYKIGVAKTGTATSLSGTTQIVIRSVGHEVPSGATITALQAQIASAYPLREADCNGTFTTQSSFAATSTGTGPFTVTLSAHGLIVGDRVTLSGAVTGTGAITSVTTNTFTVNAGFSGGVGAVGVLTLDTLKISARDAATSSITGPCTFEGISHVSGLPFTVSALTSRSIAAGGSSFFTTDQGLFKIESSSTPFLEAGLPPGLDVGVSIAARRGVISPNSQVGYRVAFGRTDASGRLVVGAPSEIGILINPKIPVPGTSIAASGANLTITNPGHGLANGDVVKVYDVQGATPAIANGTSATVSSATSTTFVLSFSGTTFAVTPGTTLSYSSFCAPLISFSVPSEVRSSSYTYYIYRTSTSSSDESVPFVDFRLLKQGPCSSASFIEFTDTIDSILLAGGEELYTNPTVAGEGQANLRPPKPTDMAFFKNYLFLIGNEDYRTLFPALVAPSRINQGLRRITIGAQEYQFRWAIDMTSIGNQRTVSGAVAAAGTTTVTQVAHGMLVGDIINVIDGGVILGAGEFSIASVPTADSFTITGGNTGSGTIAWEGVRDSAGRRLVQLTVEQVAGVGGATLSVTLAEAIDSTARALVKAINRNPNSPIYSQYASGINDAPGQLYTVARDIGQTATSWTASSSGIGEAFEPILPTSGTAVSDSSKAKANELRISRLLEPEAFPAENGISVGSETSPILRVVALRDSLIVIKADGIFRITGDSPQNFTATALDSTVICSSSRSVALLNNSVFCLSNQGFVQISDSSVRILSRPIEPLVSGILGLNLEALSQGVGYESDRTYRCTAPSIDGGYTCFAYNYLTDCWSTFNGQALFQDASVEPDDDLLLHSHLSDRKDIFLERKDTTVLDYTEQSYPVFYEAWRTSKLSISTGSSVCRLESDFPHDLVIGQDFTLRGSIQGATLPTVATVSQVISPTVLFFDLAAAATATATERVQFNPGRSFLSGTATFTGGQNSISLNLGFNHGLTNLDYIWVVSASSGVTSNLLAASDILSYRRIVATTATTITLNATRAFTGSGSGTLVVSGDLAYKSTPYYGIVTVPTSQPLPEVGDILRLGENFARIEGVVPLSQVSVGLSLASRLPWGAEGAVELYKGYPARLVSTPFIAGDAGQLKRFSEVAFISRQSGGISLARVSFASTGRTSSDQTLWLGEDSVIYGGCGYLSWGGFAWGADDPLASTPRTLPSKPIRLYIPAQVATGTWLQWRLTSLGAGDIIGLQSVSIAYETLGLRSGV